jgi:hypothetical protein
MISAENISLICEAAEYESSGRKKLREMERVPIYPQGWLTKRRWETYEERKGMGDIKKPKLANPKERGLPKNWHTILGRAIYKHHTGLIENYENGRYSDLNNLTPDIFDIVVKAVKESRRAV